MAGTAVFLALPTLGPMHCFNSQQCTSSQLGAPTPGNKGRCEGVCCLLPITVCSMVRARLPAGCLGAAVLQGEEVISFQNVSCQPHTDQSERNLAASSAVSGARLAPRHGREGPGTVAYVVSVAFMPKSSAWSFTIGDIGTEGN